MTIVRRLSALKLSLLVVGLLAGSAVTLTAMPTDAYAGKTRASKSKVPSKNAKPKKSILKQPGKFKVSYDAKAARKDHVRKTIARENRILRAEAVAKRKAKRVSPETLSQLSNKFDKAPKSRVQKTTNRGKGVTFSNTVMVRTIPADNVGRKVPKRS